MSQTMSYELDRQIPPVSKDAMLRAVGQIERIILGTLR